MASLSLQDLGELDPDSITGKKWELLVAENPASGFMQSAYWALFKRQMGFSAVHLGLFDGEELCGGAIFYAAPACKGAGFLTAPDGPVLPWDEGAKAEHGLKMLVEAIRSKAQSLGCMALRIAPKLRTHNQEILRGFGKAPINLTENKTMYLHLGKDAQDLLMDIKPKARYNIGLAERKGVTVLERSSLSAAKDFYSIMQTVSKRDKFSVEPLSFFIALISTLCPPKMAKVIFAEHEGDILGALLTITFGGRTTYLYGGISNLKRNYMGGYALQWAAINAAKDAGSSIYDFWGYDPTALPESSYAGFSRFKSQFCGEPVQFVSTLDYYFVDYLADAVVRAFKEIELAKVSGEAH
jgi:lipid II:glycine glycyltransferase (peptidoglycan interpeptide bridge formation enzyme)